MDGVQKRVALPAGSCRADQGLELNVVSSGLVKVMGYKQIALTSRDFSGLTMNTDGFSSELTHFVTFRLQVLGVSRIVDAFVRPRNRRSDVEVLHLLLGLPWLNSVDARIHIRDAQIQLGDAAHNEKPVIIQGPRLLLFGTQGYCPCLIGVATAAHFGQVQCLAYQAAQET